MGIGNPRRPGRLAGCARLLDQAKALADGDAVRARIGLFEKAVWSYMAPDRWVTRMAIPMSGAIPGGVRVPRAGERPGGKLYLNVIRVTCPALSGAGRLGIDTWVTFCTVHEADRLAEIELAP